MHFIFYKQMNAMDCGVTCLRMVAKYYGKHYNAATIRKKTGMTKDGVSLLSLSEAAEQLGFRTRGAQITYKKLENVALPVILHWNQNHFVILTAINKKMVHIADPAIGNITYKKDAFSRHWLSTIGDGSEKVGTVLLLEPTPAFHKKESEKENKISWRIFTQYFNQNKNKLGQLLISLLIGMLLQLGLPFLTQTMVDMGINTRNIHYITIVLIAQLMLTFSITVIGFIRSRLQLRIATNLNLSVLSDFWIKMTRLPLEYFDNHQAGDTMQRIEDNRQIQSFLSGQGLTIIFSLLTALIYAVILTFYNVKLFVVFFLGNLLYFMWIRMFFRARRQLNYETFKLSSQESSNSLQLIQGMQEIRLNNAEKLKRWQWEDIQAKLFRLNFKSLDYTQWQATGGLFISQGKDLIISFLVAQLVIEGKLTFGAMIAIQYIIGQLTAPVQQFISLSQTIQDAKISMERLNEIHTMEDEEPINNRFLTTLPICKSISLSQMSFSYPGGDHNLVLENIDLVFPEGKLTAIVGESGSGKTTLLKILLKIHNQYGGKIEVGECNLKSISPSFWRKQCGAVLQDGFIFSDTIAHNIALGIEQIDSEKLLSSCRTANILPFIESLPKGFNTRLGADGVGISQGQRQRLLIARAMYKDPQYLFFDEATNSLDGNNEKEIIKNLHVLFKGKTVVVIAHRLSTVRNADKIFVLKKGKIVEQGTHDSLTLAKGHYYELVKNQLDLNV